MSKTARLTKEVCSTLRGQLRDLGYGQAEAENAELFGRRLYPVPEHLRALDPSVVLVVGPRGAGKSELFNAFFSDDEALASAIRSHAPHGAAAHLGSETSAWRKAYPVGIYFPDSVALAQCVKTDEDAKDLWHAMLVRILAKDIPDAQRAAVEPLITPMAAQLSDVLQAAKGLGAAPTAALDALEQQLSEEERWLFVGYDELDTLGGFDWALMARLVRGLVAFWSDYSRRWRRIRAKIFLRSDLFRRHAGMGSADFAKLAANRAEIAWSDAALLGMLIKRIANTSEELADYCRKGKVHFEEETTLELVPRVEKPSDAYPLLERLAGQHMGAGSKKGYVRNWVLDHLRDGNGQIVPRTLVRLFELAASKEAANRTVRPPRLIHPTAFRQALDDVSNDHLRQGITSEWPWLAGVRDRARQQPLVPWQRDEIERLLGSNWDDSWGVSDSSRPVRPPLDRPKEFVDYLIELGIFRQRPDGRVDVPDLYLFGLGLRRKGGVAAGRKKGKAGRR